MVSIASQRPPSKNTDHIIAQLDIAAEYAALGVRVAGKPSASGWMPVHAIGRDDQTASAAINLQTGRYKDHGGDGDSLSLWDAAVKVGRFVDWREARDHYAARTGVATGDTIPGGRAKAKPAPKPPTVYATSAEALAEYERRHGCASTWWEYLDADGVCDRITYRWDREIVDADGKVTRGKEYRPIARHGDGWICGDLPEPRPLYRLPTLPGATRVYDSEGEKAGDATVDLGLIGTTSPNGSGSARKADWTPLAGKEVIILPDNDAPGKKYEEDVVAMLSQLEPRPVVKIVRLPDLPEGGDAYDYVERRKAEGATRDEIRAEIEAMADAAEPVAMATVRKPSRRKAKSEQDASDDIDEGRDAKRIVVKPAVTPVSHTLSKITDCLLSTGQYYMRADQLVTVDDDRLRTVLSAPELAGELNQYVEFFFVEGASGEYRPLPPYYANVWLAKPTERRRLSSINLFTRNPVYSRDWRLTESGYDPASGIYYSGPTIAAGTGTKHLDALLQGFCFKTRGDRTNYIAMLLTALLVPHFIGTKPATLFNGNQPLLGKTILSQLIAIIRDGQKAETATYNPNDEEFEKRLGAIVHSGATTVIIDNAKAKGKKSPRIESACLERSITDHVLSFRLLGHSQSIRAENSHIFCLTANTADVGRDVVTRSVVVNLYYEGEPTERKYIIEDPEGYAIENRTALLGELIGMVERWRAAGMPMADVTTRFTTHGWGKIVGGILQACGEPDFLANAREAAMTLDETRREFGFLVDALAGHPQGSWTAAELVELCQSQRILASEIGDGAPRSLATKMGTIASRFVNQTFATSNGGQAVFRKGANRNGSIYQVFVSACGTLAEPAEPCGTLETPQGSAR